MKYKVKLNPINDIYYYIIYYPVIYVFFAIFSVDIARKLSLVSLFFLIGIIINEKKKSKIMSLFIIFLLVIYNTVVFGINYVIHQDFYGFVIFILVCICFSEKKIVWRLNCLLTKNTLNDVCILFILCVLFSITSGNGLQMSSEWGTTMPLLYGPYELPHTLSYQLLILFMLSSIGFHKYKDKWFLAYMLIFSLFIVWTGVRSTFLVLFILYLYEFFSIKSMSKKTIIVSILSVILLYLMFFTDILYNNPITQKTIKALSMSSGITNSRTDFISYLTHVYFTELSIDEMIMGCSIDKLRNFMALRYGNTLHAHNDFFNSLVGMGFVGLSVFSFFLFFLCKTEKNWNKVIIPIFVLAFTNGLFMYTAFTPCLSIFLIYVNSISNKRIRNAQSLGL